MKFRRRPVVVTAIQWFPPEVEGHDSDRTPVKWPNVHCLDDRGCDCPDRRDCRDETHVIRDGDIGSGAYGYWIRKDNSTAQYLRPGDFIVRGEMWPPGIGVIPESLFAAAYEPIDPGRA